MNEIQRSNQNQNQSFWTKYIFFTFIYYSDTLFTVLEYALNL